MCREFYFGNIDPFRRRDPYDYQIGEVEYQDQFIPQDHYEMWQEIIEVKGL